MIRTLAVTLTLTTATIAAADPGLEPFTSYYAFGDSLTDDGKFGTLAPPSFEGRFSTGPTYAEYIADIFEAAHLDTNNLAVGGATAQDTPEGTVPLTPISDFNSQLDVFLSSFFFGTPIPTNLNPIELDETPPDPGSNPLASVLFGANDLFALLDNDAIVESIDTEDVHAAADAVTDGIVRLSTSTGGLFNDFIVIDIADLGMTPAFAGTEEEDLAREITGDFNDRLEANLLALESDDSPYGPLNFYRFSINDLLADIFAGEILLPGVTDFENACTPSLSEFTPEDNCALVDPSLVISRLFVDGVHPNGQAQAAFGDMIISSLDDQLPSPVPLPAGLPLLLAGLGGLACVARRRRTAA